MRLLVGRRGTNEVEHRHFLDLPSVLRPGDALVVNQSATMPAAVDAVLHGARVVVHFSTPLPDGTWIIELRTPQHGGATRPYAHGRAGDRVALPGGGELTLTAAYAPRRLWTARVDLAHGPGVTEYLGIFGRPIRYAYVDVDWPISAYGTIFGSRPGSAEMPSAGRPFTAPVLDRLHATGVSLAPVVLHAGVASPEAHEKPSVERYEVSPHTARLVRRTRRTGGRIIAVGTTVVRALESSTDVDGYLRPARGWTDLVITPDRGVAVVDGLLTGFHEPQASHLKMLEAIAGAPLLQRCYDAALQGGYLFHEFGDVNLLLP